MGSLGGCRSKAADEATGEYVRTFRIQDHATQVESVAAPTPLQSTKEHPEPCRTCRRNDSRATAPDAGKRCSRGSVQDRRAHGCARRAYRDVSTACPGRTCSTPLPALELVGVLLEHQRCVGAAKAEAVGHHSLQVDIVVALQRDRQVAGFRVEVLDVG